MSSLSSVLNWTRRAIVFKFWLRFRMRWTAEYEHDYGLVFSKFLLIKQFKYCQRQALSPTRHCWLLFSWIRRNIFTGNAVKAFIWLSCQMPLVSFIWQNIFCRTKIYLYRLLFSMHGAVAQSPAESALDVVALIFYLCMFRLSKPFLEAHRDWKVHCSIGRTRIQ